MPCPPSHPHRDALRLLALLLTLALPWTSAAFAQTSPLPGMPSSRLGPDSEGKRLFMSFPNKHRKFQSFTLDAEAG